MAPTRRNHVPCNEYTITRYGKSTSKAKPTKWYSIVVERANADFSHEIMENGISEKAINSNYGALDSVSIRMCVRCLFQLAGKGK